MSIVSQISSQLLDTWSAERRRVFGAWRVEILCRRLSMKENLPSLTPSEVVKVIRHMISKRLTEKIPGVAGVFCVTVPFANLIPVSEEAVVLEAEPSCVISHRSAMVKHHLTTWILNEIFVTKFDPPDSRRIPFGTMPDDWLEAASPKGSKPKAVGSVPIHWMQSIGKWDFGWEIGWANGQPVYQTDLERTLLDILRSPEKGGGISETLDAWEKGLVRANKDRLVEYTERFESPIVRQRVGFLMEAFGCDHPRLIDWRSRLQRGGSLKLIADAPYSPRYSPTWNLSLNLPDSLRERFAHAESGDE